MLQNQKGTIIKLLKAQEAAKNYTDNYWFPYGDFLDPTDRFTDFSCENLAGKQPFITIIENLLHKDQTAEVFVQVYGLEEYAHDEPVIYADTLILFSRLPLFEIKQIFNHHMEYICNAVCRQHRRAAKTNRETEQSPSLQ